MKRILITGGAGTVGSSFIKEYYNNYEFYNFSRGEEQIADLSREYPKVNNIIGDICNLEHLVNTFGLLGSYAILCKILQDDLENIKNMFNILTCVHDTYSI